MKRIFSLIYNLSGWLIYKIATLAAILTPYPLSYFISVTIARLWFMTGWNVNIIKNNISRALDLDIKSKKVHIIAKKIYYNWAKNICDFLKHPIISKDKLKERIELVGLENLDKALQKGKGVVIFTAHIGNFEWGACRIAVEGYKIWGVSLVRENELLNKFFESYRLSKGLKTLYINKMLNVFKILKDNGIVAIPTDWDPTNKARVYNFFGKNAIIPDGSVKIAMKSGAPLVPSFIFRKGKYNHLQVIEEPVELIQDESLDNETLLNKNMEKMIEVLEKYIRENIEEWELFHDIWVDF